MSITIADALLEAYYDAIAHGIKPCFCVMSEKRYFEYQEFIHTEFVTGASFETGPPRKDTFQGMEIIHHRDAIGITAQAERPVFPK